jgi:amidohydrolase
MSDTGPTLASRTIETIVEKYTGELVDLRRDLHAHPELSWGEERTTRVVAARLAEAGVRVTRLEGTGLIAEVGDEGPIVALRADLDALPVEDTTGAPWASVTPGVAHACGHDVHTAGLVGSALALAETHARGQLPGVVRFFFQPAEEVMPGGWRPVPSTASTASSASTATRRSTWARSASATARSPVPRTHCLWS